MQDLGHSSTPSEARSYEFEPSNAAVFEDLKQADYSNPMNSPQMTLEAIFAKHNELNERNEIIRFLNHKHKIAFHVSIAKRLIDLGILVMETGKPVTCVAVFGKHGVGHSTLIMNQFILQGYVEKCDKRYILAEKGKSLMAEYFSLVRLDHKRRMKRQQG